MLSNFENKSINCETHTFCFSMTGKDWCAAGASTHRLYVQACSY